MTGNFRGRKALIMFSRDNRLVAMRGTNRTITVWDTETGSLKGHENRSLGAHASRVQMSAKREPVVFQGALNNLFVPGGTHLHAGTRALPVSGGS
jgi:hypothetical protein